MKTMIYTLDNSGTIKKQAEYSLPPKQALIAYIMQYIKHNFNTWDYPSHIDGMRESNTVSNHWYYDAGNNVFAAYPA